MLDAPDEEMEAEPSVPAAAAEPSEAAPAPSETPAPATEADDGGAEPAAAQ